MSGDQDRKSAFNKVELGIGLVFVAVFLVFLFVIIPIGIDMPRRLHSPLTSPSFLPSALGWILVGLGAALALKAFVFPAAKEVSEDTEPDRVWAIVFVILMIVGYWLLSGFLGMFLTACLISTVLIWFGGGRSWKLYFIGGFAVPLVVYLLFVRVAQVPLPRGVILPF